MEGPQFGSTGSSRETTGGGPWGLCHGAPGASVCSLPRPARVRELASGVWAADSRVALP